MPKKEIRVMIIGSAGEMGRACTRFCHERGATVVAAIGRRSHLGEDQGEVSGIGNIGVTIRPADDVAVALAQTKPDVVLECSGSLQQIADNVRTCLKAGVNVATLAEEAYFASVDEPDLTRELDELARENGVTFVGLGMQDVTWSNAAVILSANCHKLTKVYGENWCILDHCGAYEIGLVGVNLTEGEFFEYHKDDLNPRSPYTYALYEIADEMLLHVTEEINDRITPLYAEDDYDATMWAYGKVLEKGKTIGAVLCTTLKTEEGIDIVGRFYYSFAQNGQPGENIWRFEGEPTFTVTTDDPRPDIGTTTDVVNRLPDIIEARPGYLTVKDLPKPFFRCRPLPEYLAD